MTNTQFDNFLQNKLKNNNFKAGYLEEKAILEYVIVISNARQKDVYLNKNLLSCRMFTNQLLYKLNIEKRFYNSLYFLLTYKSRIVSTLLPKLQLDVLKQWYHH